MDDFLAAVPAIGSSSVAIFSRAMGSLSDEVELESASARDLLLSE